MNPNVNIELVDGGVHLIPVDDPDLDTYRDRTTSSRACVPARVRRLYNSSVSPQLQLQGHEDQVPIGGDVGSSSLSSSIPQWMVESVLSNSDASFSKNSFEILRKNCKDCCQISSNILVEEACAINKCLVTMQHEIAMDESKQDKSSQQKDPLDPKKNEVDAALRKRKLGLLHRADQMKRASSLLRQLRTTQKQLLNEFKIICHQRTSSEDAAAADHYKQILYEEISFEMQSNNNHNMHKRIRANDCADDSTIGNQETMKMDHSGNDVPVEKTRKLY